MLIRGVVLPPDWEGIRKGHETKTAQKIGQWAVFRLTAPPLSQLHDHLKSSLSALCFAFASLQLLQLLPWPSGVKPPIQRPVLWPMASLDHHVYAVPAY